MARLEDALRLMLVTDDALLGSRDPASLCREAVRGGVTSIELRLKAATPRYLVEVARRLQAELAVPIVINDRLDVALAAQADGAHLGPDDLPVALAVRCVPPGFLVGASVGTEDEVEGGALASYWGIGPYRVTSTKPDAGAALGPSGFGRLVTRAPPACPCLAIGGVEPGDVRAVLEAGGCGVAVGSGILDDPDTADAARRYAEALGIR